MNSNIRRQIQNHRQRLVIHLILDPEKQNAIGELQEIASTFGCEIYEDIYTHDGQDSGYFISNRPLTNGWAIRNCHKYGFRHEYAVMKRGFQNMLADELELARF